MVEPLAEHHDADGPSDEGIAAHERGEGGGEASLAERNLLKEECAEFAEAKECDCRQERQQPVVVREVGVDDFEHDRG